MKQGLGATLALALACGLGLTLAACGGGHDSGGSSDSAASTAAAEVSGTITVWDLNYDAFPQYNGAADQLDAEFEKLHPGVEIKHVPQPFETFEAVYQAAFTAREGPDVLMEVPGAQGVLNVTQGLEKLNDRIPDEMQEQLLGWNSVTPGFTDDGDHYGIPVGLGGLVFYYNKALFAKAGLPREFVPETWDEVREAGEKLEDAGFEAFTGGNKEGYENQWWFTVGWQTENTKEESVELAEGEIPMTDELVAKAFGPETAIQEAGLYPADRFNTPLFPDGAAKLGEGKAGMQLGLMSTTAYYGEYNPALGEKNVGMFLPPGSSYNAVSPEYAWTIPTYAKNKDGAWAYIEFISSKSAAELLAKEVGILPNRLDVKLPASFPEQAVQLVDWVKEFGLFPPVHQMIPAPVLATLSTEVNQVLQDRTSLESAQQAMQETFERTTK